MSTTETRNQTIVIALGGNALGSSVMEMHERVKESAIQIAKLAISGYKIVVCHGNGPQVGMIFNAFEQASLHDDSIFPVPFPECGAMSQGYIGYCLVQAIKNEFDKIDCDREVVSIITQTIVSNTDPAFSNPTKPIGGFITKDEAEKLSIETANVYKEDAGRGYRQVIASPAPMRIAEMQTIENLVNEGFVVVAGGGGGVPVIEDSRQLTGISAVIDKDKTASLIAQNLNAEKFVILTAVENVAINFNTNAQVNLNKATVAEMKKYCDEGQFAPGSMLPKVEACIDFLSHTPNGQAIIASLFDAEKACSGSAGTLITTN